MTLTGGVVARLLMLALIGVLLQTTALSQITIFGVPLDLSPLLVASVGLLGGSVVGAGFGFVVGLALDTALLQTLGVNSVVLVVVGYGAGRLRETRDPSHGLVPMAVGATATAVATVGFAVLTFLLGLNAPVSLLLVRQILISIVVNTLLALPLYAIVRRALRRALPDHPRQRRRSSAARAGLSPFEQP